MKKQLLFAFGAAALLASCSNDIDTPQVGQDGQLRVNATIEGLKTRMTGTAWQADDQIGISDGNTYTNVPYAYGNTTFEAVDKAIVLTGASEYTFKAYYPYAEEGGTVEFDVVDADGTPKAVKEVDFLYASGAKAQRTAPEVNFSFQHMMARLALTFTNDDESLEDDATISYQLSSVATTGEFDTTTGEVNPGDADGIVEVASATLGEPSALILPSYASASANETAIKVVVTVVNDGETVNYSGTITPALLASNQYNYTLDIAYGKELVIKGATIGEWKENPGTLDDGGLTEGGEKEETPYVAQIGDYLLNDGSILASDSEELDSKKSEIAAVVFYTGNAGVEGYTKGLAVALENAGNAVRFFTGNSSSDMTNWYNGGTIESGKESLFSMSQNTFPSEMHGYSNTLLLKEGNTFSFTAELEKYNSEKKVTNASDWFLPSHAELVVLGNVLDDIKESITNANGELESYNTFSSTDQKDNFYWSSDFFNAANNWAYPLCKPEGVDNKNYRVSAGNSDKSGYFRFAIAF